MRLSKLTIAPALMALGACAADIPYTKLGDSWASSVGYSDFEIGNNKYKVMYTGGVYNSPSKVTQYAYQRAKELCKEKGFNDFTASNTDAINQQSHIGVDSSMKSQVTYSLEVECKNK
jgi:hypothetical protein